MTVDEHAVLGASSEGSVENRCLILAQLRYQTRLAKSSITIWWDIIIRKNTKERVPELPDSEEVGVFVGDIMGWVE